MPLVRNGPILLLPSPNVVPGPDTFAFQVSPTDEDITQAIANYAKASNIKNIGMLAATDTSGEVGVASAKKIFPAEKIEMKLARIDLRATDASTQLASVASDDVGLVYSSYSGGGAITVVKSFQILGTEAALDCELRQYQRSFRAACKGRQTPETARRGGVGDRSRHPERPRGASALQGLH